MSEAYIVRGEYFGDEGKGSITDFISQWCGEVIKEGGPQAMHHLISRRGKLHRAEQMGSGVFNPGVGTFCSKNMFVNPPNLIEENLMLVMAGVYDGMTRTFIDSRCPIVTPLHQMIGRMLEISRGRNRHGSTGMGVGQTVNDKKIKGDKVLCVGDMIDESVLEEKIAELFREKFRQAETLVDNNPNNRKLAETYQRYRESLSAELLFNRYYGFVAAYPASIVNDGEGYFSELLKSDENLVFEGSQGVLLDPELGFTPYTTKTKTTFKTAEELLAGRLSRSSIKKIGVLRAYATRHGAGPFVTENKNLARKIPDTHNRTNPWQGKFRIGWFDLPAVRYAMTLGGEPDYVALTNLDRLSELNSIRVCTSYEYRGNDEGLLDEFFEWEDKGGIVRITAFKRPKSTNDNISRVLLDCKPLDFERFSGWKKCIGNVKREENLPKEAKKYLGFLRSENGFDRAISILSVGPTSENKIELSSC